MSQKIILLTSFVLLLGACSSTPAPAPEKTVTTVENVVKLQLTDASTECREVAEVQGDSGYWASPNLSKSMKDARASIRTRAIDLGANMVVLDPDNQIQTRVLLIGKAYKCP